MAESRGELELGWNLVQLFDGWMTIARVQLGGC